jgi:hypothetical protein
MIVGNQRKIIRGYKRLRVTCNLPAVSTITTSVFLLFASFKPFLAIAEGFASVPSE